jgi:hypothetical protein
LHFLWRLKIVVGFLAEIQRRLPARVVEIFVGDAPYQPSGRVKHPALIAADVPNPNGARAINHRVGPTLRIDVEGGLAVTDAVQIAAHFSSERAAKRRRFSAWSLLPSVGLRRTMPAISAAK